MPETLTLYSFQEAAMLKVRREMRKGNKHVMLYSPTGSGKTEMSMVPMNGAAIKGNKAAFLADRIVLVDQTSRRLWKYGIMHGVIQGENTRGIMEPIKVMSVQTMARRGYWDEEIEIVVMDEAHNKHAKILAALTEWGCLVLGLSASPITEGLGQFWDCVVNAATTVELLNTINPDTGRPYLCPLVLYAAREINMQGAAISAGEWQVSHVEMRTRQIIGNIVPEWFKRCYQHFDGTVPTLVFSRSIKQGEEICQAFTDAGVGAKQSTYRESRDDTDKTLKDFQAGKFQVLISVDRFVKGYDNPSVQCILDCNPRRTSLAPLIQGMGRGMREMEGKEICVYVDFCGNVAGWYDEIQDIWIHGVSELDDKFVGLVRREGKERKPIVCPKCSFITGGLAKTGGICPSCGWQAPKTTLQTVPGYTEPVEGLTQAQQAQSAPEWTHDRDWVWGQLCSHYLVSKKGDQAQALKTSKWMFQNIYGEWPPHGIAFKSSDEPVNENVTNRIKHHNIKYAKSKKKGKGEK